MSAQAFIKLIRHPVKFRMFLFAKLPSAFFAGLRIRDMDEKRCSVEVPYKWFTRNPFRSTYFACLSMAAEMSTGALAMAHLYKRKPSVSMLVVKVESEYYRKAVGKTIFECREGAAIKNTIEEAINTAEARSIAVPALGKNGSGDVVAKFTVTWSFKVRQH